MKNFILNLLYVLTAIIGISIIVLGGLITFGVISF